jgi:ketosteroid isomerase-like protein
LLALGRRSLATIRGYVQAGLEKEDPMQPADIHRHVEAAFNAGEVDALVALYEPDAVMVGEDGTVAEGLDAIRQTWAGLVALGGKVTMTTRFAVESGDVVPARLASSEA